MSIQSVLRVRLRPVIVLVAVALAAGQAFVPPLRAQNGPAMYDSSLAVATVVAGLNHPTMMTFIGAAEFFVVEQTTGRIMHAKDGVAQLAIDLAVESSRGALGIAAHPRFSENRYVYVLWAWRGSGTGKGKLEGTDSTNIYDVDEFGLRIDRFTWNGTILVFNRNIARFPARTVLNYQGRPVANHQGGVMTFGPDGKLYAHIGEQHLRGRLQNVMSGPDPTNENFTGVVVRLNDDGGTPRDNPFVAAGRAIGGQAGRNTQRIFAYGIRNGFGLSFDPLSGLLWMTENGDDLFDEINLVLPGFNSRWIQMMGPVDRYDQYRAEETQRDGLDGIPPVPPDLALTAQDALARLYVLSGSHHTDPLFSWKWSMGVAALEFVRSDVLAPALQRGQMLVGDFYTGRLYRFILSTDRRDLDLSAYPALSDRVADNFRRGDLTESDALTVGSGFGVVSDIESGSDGNLYVVSWDRGAIYEIYRR